MPIHNEDVAHMFEEMADLLEIQGANPFRVRAYRNAATTIRDLSKELSGMVERGEDLTQLPGIGKDLAGKIHEILQTGSARFLKKLRREVPASLEELLKIPGLGPKRVKQVFEQLHIKTLRQLEVAARTGTLRDLPGFGVKTEQRILEAIEQQQVAEKRFMIHVARQYGESLVAYLKQVPDLDEVVIAGSYRRGKDTVGDLDILVTTGDSANVMRHFAAYDEVAKVVSKGGTRSSVILRNGLQVDVRVVPTESFGAALHYFTGSKAHNIQIRRLGQQRGLKINEYGVFKDERRVAGATEGSVFESVGLPYIDPELREDHGEIEAARAGNLPALIELADLQGDLHIHTSVTDGHDTLESMARAAQLRGFKYLAITDHTQHLTVAHGLDEKRLLQQLEAIDRLNARLSDITLLKGIEVDILEDGTLDLPDRVLAQLDLVIGAVHSHFRLSRKKQTERILRAMDHRYFSMLAHPSGRLLEERAAYDVDMERIIKLAAQRGCYLELNAQPKRLDLTDIHCRIARDAGVKVSINSDAHSAQQFDYLGYGVKQARRGWLRKDDVLNSRPLRELKALLRKTLE